MHTGGVGRLGTRRERPAHAERPDVLRHPSDTRATTERTPREPLPRLDRPRRPGGRHRARPGHGRRAEGRQRPPRHRDEPGPRGLPALPERHAPRPGRPDWLGRDRFVLSCGHSSLTQYIQLYLGGYGLELDDLKALRTWGSRTPGPPRARPHRRRRDHHRAARPGRRHRRRHGDGRSAASAACSTPTPRPGESPFDHHVYAIASDGDLQEGVSAEASSLAGHQQLGNLVVIYDDNQISIEDDTDIAFTEDVATRYEAYGWHVADVDWTNGGTRRTSRTSTPLLAGHPRRAQKRDRPPEPHHPPHDHRLARAQRPEHRQARTAPPSATTRSRPPRSSSASTPRRPSRSTTTSSPTPAALLRARQRGRHQAWDEQLRRVARGQPRARRAARPVCVDAPPARRLDRRPADLRAPTPRAWPPARPPARCSARSRRVLPELWGGSADLAESNNTTMKGEPSFIPAEHATKKFTGDPYGRTLHFGIREHAMGSILNGIALHGGTRAYGGTFLVFSDYMRPAVRLAAIMQLPVTYVWTHDSIGLGEDGPTHQPVEHLAALRAIPGLAVVRPADANETAAAWQADPGDTGRPGRPRPHPPEPARRSRAAPTATRRRRRRGQGRLRPGRRRAGDRPTSSSSPPAPRSRSPSRPASCSRSRASRPAWSRCRAASGSTPRTRAYRDSVLPPAVRARVSVEAGVAHGLARARRRRRPHRVARALRRLRATTRSCTASSASPPEAVVKAAKDEHRRRRATACSPHRARPGRSPTRRRPPDRAPHRTSPDSRARPWPNR